jgi:hypothetical protein
MVSRGGGKGMNRKCLVESVAVAALALAFCPLLIAQTSSQSEAAKTKTEIPSRNFEGVWSTSKSLRAPIVAPMTPEAQAKFDSNSAETKAGKPISKDPVFQCRPPGMPQIFAYGLFAIEFLQTGKRIFLFYENIHSFRTIYMDGRQMPSDVDVDPTWLGYSIGHWDGNDLVVETGRFNDKTWLDMGGHPHSDALHVTERFHRVDGRNMTLEVTIDDPKSYTKPWTMNAAYKLQPAWELQETFCIPEEQMKFYRDEADQAPGPGR